VLRERTERDVLVLPVGPLATAALEAAARLEQEGLGVTVVDPRWVLPVDPELATAAASYRLVVTVEDAAPSGGFGDQVGRALRQVAGPNTPNLRCLALPAGRFLAAGGRAELLERHGLGADGIVEAVESAVG
jgi:1-deoxy-D-xylulose-5-phosphate synthase